MWPGCSTSFNGIRPTYEVPFDDYTTSDEKMDQVLQWLDLPMEDRPQIINVYIQGIDQHGHKYGPYDNLVSFRRRIQCTLQFTTLSKTSCCPLDSQRVAFGRW